MQLVQNQRNRFFLALAFLALGFIHPLGTHAAGIDAIYKYAWSNVGGWVNFAPSQSPVSVTDSAVSGYAWSANDGWINFAPAHGGVTNDGAGNLGGFAWDSTQGWVSFTGVSINTGTGKFTGQATGANGYILTFDCKGCNVVTDWRPASSGASSQTPSHTSTSGQSISPLKATPAPTPGVATTVPTPTHVSTHTSAQAPIAQPSQTSVTPSNHASSTSHSVANTIKARTASLAHTLAIPTGIVLVLALAFWMFRFFL